FTNVAGKKELTYILNKILTTFPNSKTQISSWLQTELPALSEPNTRKSSEQYRAKVQPICVVRLYQAARCFYLFFQNYTSRNHRGSHLSIRRRNEYLDF